jgi:hypothetical protein
VLRLRVPLNGARSAQHDSIGGGANEMFESVSETLRSYANR